jgi:hypothetical protein
MSMFRSERPFIGSKVPPSPFRLRRAGRVQNSASPLTAEMINLIDKETLTKANIDCRSKMGWNQEKAERWKVEGVPVWNAFRFL